jgi:hypothetical protein
MWKPGIGWLIAVLVVVLLVAAGISFSSEDVGRASYRLSFVTGSMFISDAGESHGGFEFTAEYRVVITPTHGVVIYSGYEVNMNLTLETGLGDPISAHDFEGRITYAPVRDEIGMALAKTTVLLVHDLKDTVWDHAFDGYYIASWGGSAPPEELRGEISPSIFGLPSHYYVELRLDIHVVPAV